MGYPMTWARLLDRNKLREGMRRALDLGLLKDGLGFETAVRGWLE
jgi:hypothetical protein